MLVPYHIYCSHLLMRNGNFYLHGRKSQAENIHNKRMHAAKCNHIAFVCLICITLFSGSANIFEFNFDL